MTEEEVEAMRREKGDLGCSLLPAQFRTVYNTTRVKKWGKEGGNENKAEYTAQDAPSMRTFHLRK